MKNIGFKMLVKKFTAYALVAAMTISTPLTAFAADFSDNFSKSDGANGSDSETDTISSTDTNTTVLSENGEKITDLVIYGPSNITMLPKEQEVITAVVLTSGSLQNAKPADLNKKIRWKSSAPSVVSISAESESMNKCTLNARNTGEATITASLDADQDGVYDHTASVKVVVFEPSRNNIRWNITDTFYVKHTYSLSDYLVIDGNVNAMDVVTFAVKGSPKVATISGDELTVKGAGDITLSAVLPDGTDVSSEKIITKAGNPVKKLIASESKLELDFGEDGVEISEPKAEVYVEVVTADSGDEDDEGDNTTTDEITWKPSNSAIADVVVYSTDQTKATIIAKAVGKTTITAKSTSGKTAKFNVTVKATLISIDSVTLNNDSGYAWSGKTDELIIERTPKQNKDKFKVTSDDKRVKVKSTVNNVTITPVNDLKLSAGEDEEGSEDSIPVTITVESSDKYSDAEPKEAVITVKQSDVEVIGVIFNDGNSTTSIDKKTKKTVRTNPGEAYDCGLKLNEKCPIPGEDAVSWVSSNVKVAAVNGGHLEVVGQGTAKITASSVYKEKKSGKYKPSKITFTVKATPECESIVLKSNTAAYDKSDKSKKKTVTINIKQQLPKKSNDEIEWYINGIKQTPSKNVTDKKLVVQPKEFNGMKEGTVEVMAVSKMNSTVYTVATIYVINKKATKVEFASKYKKGVSLKVGNTMPISAPTVTAAGKAKSDDPIVSYTVDKKGASVVRAEKTKDGGLKLTGVGEGKATVTALTASGKKGTLKVTVK